MSYATAFGGAALGCGPGGCSCGGRCRSSAGLGQGCPPCHLLIDSRCVACPEGADLPECDGCVEGRPPEAVVPWYERPLAGPVVVGLVSAVAIGVAIPLIRRQLGKRGIALE